MSTERELTPGGPPQLHAIPYPSDLASSIQINGGVNLMSKQYGMFFIYRVRKLK